MNITRGTWATGALALSLLVLGLGASDHTPAYAAGGTTTAVSGGPDTFTQVQPTGNPSEYNKPLERCANGVDHTVSGPNPILSEPATTHFTSNLPLTVSVRNGGDQWWDTTAFVFTNRSATAFHVDCAVLIFRAPSGSGDHAYTNARPYGHPQQDYVEVPKGDGTSFYIARLDFHDVPLAQRIAYPGQSFEYHLSGPAGPVTREQIRDSLRFYGDLDLAANNNLVVKYGTSRMTN